MISWRLLTCLAGALALHVLVGFLLARLPEQPRLQRPTIVEMRVVEPPPTPEKPPPEPEKPPEEPKIQPTETPKPLQMQQQPQKIHIAARADRAHQTPPSERAVTTDNATDTPTFGFSIESTSEGGKGPAMPVGNTLQVPGGGPKAQEVKPLAVPVLAREVTKDPLPTGRCTGKMTDEARDAGIEGSVVLSLVVDAEGNAQNIRVKKKLGYGLDERAIAVMKACKFSPGEHAGKKVAVEIPAFKVTFLPPDTGD